MEKKKEEKMENTVEFMGKTGRFEVKYKGESEWRPTTEAKIRHSLEGNCSDIEMAIGVTLVGLNTQTPFALYRFVVTLDGGKTWHQENQ